jgi:hypothetical protein
MYADRHRAVSVASAIKNNSFSTMISSPEKSLRIDASFKSANQAISGPKQRSASDEDIKRRLQGTVHSQPLRPLPLTIDDGRQTADAALIGFQGSTLPSSYRHREVNKNSLKFSNSEKLDAMPEDITGRSEYPSIEKPMQSSVISSRQNVDNQTPYMVHCTGRLHHSSAKATNANTSV